MGVIYRGTTAIVPKIGTTAINKVYRGTVLLWENWTYKTGSIYSASVGPSGYDPSTFYATTGVGINIRNLNISVDGYWGNGDEWPMECYLGAQGKRASDNVWVNFGAQYMGDVGSGSSKYATAYWSVGSDVEYNQFQYYVYGNASNPKSCSGRVYNWYQQG